MAGITYTIKKNRIERGCMSGLESKGRTAICKGKGSGDGYLFLRSLDSAVADSEWGRMHFDMQIEEEMVVYVYLAAMNENVFYRNDELVRIDDFLADPDEPLSIKKTFFERVSAKRFLNRNDILLYDLKGRYLYIAIEVTGIGEAVLDHLVVDLHGDNFMETFPEVYRERNSFFHRYLSVFSSIYNDFQNDIAALPQLLDLDTCPKELLPIYAGWLGIDVGNDFLGESKLRMLVKETYRLNRIKGTKKAISRIAEIVLGEPVKVLERNVMQNYIPSEEMHEFEKLYGKSIYDVTLLVNSYVSENLKSQLMFLLNQFKPIRSRIHVIFLKPDGMLDSHCYLDMNARVYSFSEGALDERQTLDGMTCLSE